ncbi:MAG: DUF4301 family protein [Flavobacteriaceae bacterium]
MLTEKDQKRIIAQGRSLELIIRQEEQLKKDIQPLQKLEVAVLNDGIHQLTTEEQKQALHAFHKQDGSQTWMKFVPASGAASRMFSSLYNYQSQKRAPHFALDDYLAQEENQDVKTFINQLKRFPFFATVYAYLINHPEAFQWEDETFFDAFIEALLNKEHLGYSQLPKGLIPFFTDENGNAFTPFEAHLQEALKLAPQDQQVGLHFTIDKLHRQMFETLADQFLGENSLGLDITYSYQHPLTDTPILDQNNQWVRDEEGHLLFRKGGHGALLENLNLIDSDFVWLKNIDNIQWGQKNDLSVQWMQILGGVTLSIQKQIFDHIKTLEELREKTNTEPIIAFIKSFFDPTFQFASNRKPKHQKLIDYLDRPLRICGMIKNEGKPGGGPFWMHSKRGRNLQIVEGVELDLNTQAHQQLMDQTTHFNPVLMVCAITDAQGEKFPLHEFSDDQRYMIAHKTLGAKKIKALEWPGLWNGGMAHWNTLFVEVPKATFHPVKKITDLLVD